MQLPKISGGSVIASVVLAVLVLGLFAPLRNYGPQSAVRRFQQAVASRNVAAISQVSVEPANDESLLNLARFVYMHLQYGQPRLGGFQPDNDRAKVLIIYQNQFSGPQTVVFFVDLDRDTRRWRVNCTATMIALTDYPRSVRGF